MIVCCLTSNFKRINNTIPLTHSTHTYCTFLPITSTFQPSFKFLFLTEEKEITHRLHTCSGHTTPQPGQLPCHKGSEISIPTPPSLSCPRHLRWACFTHSSRINTWLNTLGQKDCLLTGGGGVSFLTHSTVLLLGHLYPKSQGETVSPMKETAGSPHQTNTPCFFSLTCLAVCSHHGTSGTFGKPGQAATCLLLKCGICHPLPCWCWVTSHCHPTLTSSKVRQRYIPP